LLNGLLSLCLPTGGHGQQLELLPADLLDQCLTAVLPICNTQDHPIKSKGKQKTVDKELLADGLGLRQYLTEY
jgi:hypothetical protein